MNIVIEQRKKMDIKYNPNILGSDNVLILFGQNVCVVFDSDFASFLFDKTQPIFSQTIINSVEKVGFVEEDIRSIFRILIENEQYDQ